MDRPSVRVCLTPDMLRNFSRKKNEIVVVVDILRATTSMCVALACGAKAIIPVDSGIEDLRLKVENLKKITDHCKLAAADCLLAGESDGIKLPHADLGNSPLEFMSGFVDGKVIIFSTTNGTKAIKRAEPFGEVYIASFVNFKAIQEFLLEEKRDVLILCSGWKGQFSLEDTLFAGKLAEGLANEGDFMMDDDAVISSVSLWHQAQPDLLAFAARSSHYQRLLKIESEVGLRFCFEPEEEEVLPRLIGGKLVNSVYLTP